MYCQDCGTVLWHDAVPGQITHTYCRKCDPPKVTLNKNPDKVNPSRPKNPYMQDPSDWDISMSDLGVLGDDDILQTPVPSAVGATVATGPPLTFDPAVPDDFQIITSDGTNDIDWGLNIQADGVPILQVHEDLPEDAAQGAIAYIRGESAAYVFDGDDWHNLGQVVRKISGKDANCDRRAAVAATKRKADG